VSTDNSINGVFRVDTLLYTLEEKQSLDLAS